MRAQDRVWPLRQLNHGERPRLSQSLRHKVICGDPAADEVLALRGERSRSYDTFTATAAWMMATTRLVISPPGECFLIRIALRLSRDFQLRSLRLERAACCILALAKRGLLQLKCFILSDALGLGVF